MEKQQLIWKPVPKFSPPSLWHFFACIWWHKALAAIPAPYFLSCAPLAAAWLHSLPFNSQYPQRGYWGDSALQWGAQQENKKQRPHPAEAGAPISSRSQNVPAQGLALLEGLFQELPLEHLSSRVVILRCFTGVGGQKDHCDQCEEKVVPISSSNEGHDEQWGVWELWHHPPVAPLHDHQARSPAWWEEGPQCKHPKSASSPTPEWASFKFLFGDWRGNHDHQQGGPKKGAAEMDCRKFLAVSRNTGQRNHCPGPDFHLMWPLVPLFMSIMERNKMLENFLHPDCKNRVKVGHFLHYFRAHSLLLKHVM